MFRAVFFDRDGTLTESDPAVRAALRAQVERWSGRPYEMNYERMMRLFDEAGYPKDGLKSVAGERAFWLRYYERLLREEGVTACVPERAAELLDMIWLRDRRLFPEVREVLAWFREHGYRIGVISDTSPSLRLTLEALGIGEYLDACVCSDEVGAMKPDPRIYRAALEALDVRAEESLYVDDYDVEADGARALGFTAFHLSRNGAPDEHWRIQTLRQLVEYAKQHQ